LDWRKKKKTQRTRTQRDENSQTNSASFYSKVSRALMAALAHRSLSLFIGIFTPSPSLSLSYHFWQNSRRNKNATPTQQRRRPRAFNPKMAKTKRKASRRPWPTPLGVRRSIFRSLSLSALPPTLSRSAAHAPKLSFKARERALRGWIVGGWVVNAKASYRGRSEMGFSKTIRRSTINGEINVYRTYQNPRIV